MRRKERNRRPGSVPESPIGRCDNQVTETERVQYMYTDNPKYQCVGAADRAFVAQLITDRGLSLAAKTLGLSRLATLNVAAGQPVYTKTQAAVKSARKKAA